MIFKKFRRRRILFLLVILLASVSSVLMAGEPGPVIRVEAGGISINGKLIEDVTLLSSYLLILGEPATMRSAGTSVFYTFPEQGIELRGDESSGKVDQIGVFYSAELLGPDGKAFSGELYLDKRPVDPEDTVGALPGIRSCNRVICFGLIGEFSLLVFLRPVAQSPRQVFISL